jgi:polysaccharide biosynthesis transport protein
MIQQPLYLEQARAVLQIDYSIEQLQTMVSAQPRRRTQLIEVSTVGNDPAVVRDIANTVSELFIADQGQTLSGVQNRDALRLVQPALLPESPLGPTASHSIILAVLVGVIIAVLGVVVIEALDNTVDSTEKFQTATRLAVLGSVNVQVTSAIRDTASRQPQSYNSLATEPFERIRANLEFAAISHPMDSILVTSPDALAAKSMTAVQLAVSLARAGKSVLLIDANLRYPALHQWFDISGRSGLSEWLLRGKEASGVTIQETGHRGVSILPSGQLPPNPAELLSGQRMRDLLQTVTSEYDVVLIDSPPVLTASDTLILAGCANATLLVADAEITTTETAARSVEMLSLTRTFLLGGVLVHVTNSRTKWSREEMAWKERAPMRDLT